MDALIICIFKGMHWKRFRPWPIPVLIAAGIKFFSLFPHAVENYYSTGAYPLISRLLRLLFGWIPFSAGDMLYAAGFIYLVISLVRFFTQAFRLTLHRQYLLLSLKRTISIVLWVYIVFNLLWGLNYDRLPITEQMHLETVRYSKEDLKALLDLLVKRMNGIDSASREARKSLVSNDSLFRKSVQAYHALGRVEPALYYSNPSIKFSFYGYLTNYLGFSGYYNPFTGEAQVNTTIPRFIQPFTTSHEIGHQLGYAKEEEANFCGFLAAKSSPDPAFRYSVYVELYLYAASALYSLDSVAFIPYRESLKQPVRQDLRDLKAFYMKYRNPLEPVIHAMYGDYLKANRQPQGIDSYDEVVGLAIAYLRKYGAPAF
ncbi:MAG TPA: DUF3810 domain-containing protein [Chitinophagaceae bacterium]|nr:DUF3810 domain-containing protein [Chitinophagaceae bacterium]